MDRARSICQDELGWDDERWEAEEEAYLLLWQACYSLPPRSSIPDWKAMLAEARLKRAAAQPAHRRKAIKRSSLAAGLLALAAVVAWLYARSRRRQGRPRQL